jgi:hypothetical protein
MFEVFPANVYAPLLSFRQFTYLRSKPFFGGIQAPLLDNCLKLVVGGERLSLHQIERSC